MQIQPGKEKEYEEFVKLNSGDPYSARVVSYANDWAALMEAELERTANDGLVDAPAVIAAVAEQTSGEADTDGITGFMYGAAVESLGAFWLYGDALRSWHNRQYLPEDKAAEADKKKQTVNPALLNIEV